MLAAVAVVSVALIAVAASPVDLFRDNSRPAVIDTEPPATSDRSSTEDHDQRALHGRPGRPGRSTTLGLADGAVPNGVTVFDDDIPGVARLDPDLLGALRRAAAAAADDGVDLVVNSGWRSQAYQQHLLDEAVAKYGSQSEAARWVATPDTSLHVSGHAIDLGPSDAQAWLSEHGAGYGLCRTYRNEPWHYELRPDAGRRGCPPPYADPTQDPRLHR